MTSPLSTAQLASMYSGGDVDTGPFAWVAANAHNTRRSSIITLRTAERDTKVVLTTAGQLEAYVRGDLLGATTLIASLPEAATYQNHLAGDWMEARFVAKPSNLTARLRLACNGAFGYDTQLAITAGALASASSGYARSWVSVNGNLATPTHVPPGSVLSGPMTADQLPWGVMCGDSTWAVFDTTPSVASRIYTRAQAQRAGRGILSLATPSDTTADQQAVWTASNAKSGNPPWVAIGTGYNDAQTMTVAQMVTAYQNFVDRIRLDCPATKIIACQIAPAKATAAPAIYAKILSFNDAIAGIGPTPITGVDARETTTFPLLKDSNGDLQLQYTGLVGEVYPNGVHYTLPAKILKAQAVGGLVNSFGLL